MRGSKSSDIILGYVIPMFIVFVLVIVILYSQDYMIRVIGVLVFTFICLVYVAYHVVKWLRGRK